MNTEYYFVSFIKPNEQHLQNTSYKLAGTRVVDDLNETDQDQMKKTLLSLLIAILCLNCYSQISFEKGYYLDNSGQKIDCLIKNIDWDENPVKFKYRLSETSEVQNASIKSVKEFEIYKSSKYIRSHVKIDRSSDNLTDMNDDINPIFREEELFLKVLVEGKANLYSYQKGSLNRYFYSKDSSEIKQLIFKHYLTPENRIAKNLWFKQQLWNNFKCEIFTKKKVENIDYDRKQLVRFFVQYNQYNNQYNNQEPSKFEKKTKKDLFSLTIRLGLNNSSLTTQNNISNYRDIDFGSKIGLRFGLEAELLMPFNKNKWALLLEPSYQYFTSERKIVTLSYKDDDIASSVDYHSIELPIGIRHYFFLNENSKIFVNASYVFDFSGNSKITFDPGYDLEIKPGQNFALGMGYKYNNRYSLELRYHSNREILGNYLSYKTDYNTVSVILGYSIF